MTTQRRGRSAYITACLVAGIGIGAAAAGVGTANTAVLRWVTIAGPAPVPTTTDIVITDSAAAGMSFALNEPGTYEITMQLLGVAATSLRTGLSLNAAVAPLVANPVMGVDGVFAVGGPQTLAAATLNSILLHTTVVIGPGSVGAVLRTHATDNAGATPVAATVAASAWLRIARIVDTGA